MIQQFDTSTCQAVSDLLDIDFIHVFVNGRSCEIYLSPIRVYDTVKPVCNDHLYNKIYYLWFIQ